MLPSTSMSGEAVSDLTTRPAPKDVRQQQQQIQQPQPQPQPQQQQQQHEELTKRHKHSRSSYTEPSPLSSRNSLAFRPAKRPMPSPDKTIAVINASGRQAASFIRVATAVGYHVRAQLRTRKGVIATEVATNPHVTLLEGELYIAEAVTPPLKPDGSRGSPDVDILSLSHVDVTRDGPIRGVGINHALIEELFRGAELAFINTTFYGDELRIGEALADAAKRAGVQHYVYSSMPDHHTYNPEWPSLPLWASKHHVEEYIRGTGLPATFVYTGIYNNNFTSLPYPLFCTDLQPDGSWIWQAPFHPDVKLPWLDAEHDMGPAILQIFKEGASRWGGGRRVALAYEMLTPVEACRHFSRGVGRPVRYVRGPIEVTVKIPEGYRAQLEALEQLFDPTNRDPARQPPYFGDAALEASCPRVALELWEGCRGLEEYAREVFPLEEQANGLTWMLEGGEGWVSSGQNGGGAGGSGGGDQESDDEDDDGLVMRGMKRDDEEWLA